MREDYVYFDSIPFILEYKSGMWRVIIYVLNNISCMYCGLKFCDSIFIHILKS